MADDNDALVAAYNDTTYTIDLLDQKIALRPNSTCPQLDQFLIHNQFSHAVIITAFNPRSAPQTLEENQLANQDLAAKLLKAGYTLFYGAGQGNDTEWPPEDSFMVCGIVRRHIKWNTWQSDLRESLAHLIDHIKRRVCGIASAVSPWFFV